MQMHAFLLDQLGCDALTFKGGNGANFLREIIRDYEESMNHGVGVYLTHILKIKRIDLIVFTVLGSRYLFSPALSSGSLEKRFTSSGSL